MLKTDLEIAQAAKMKDIRDIASSAGIDESCLELYGPHKAKVTGVPHCTGPDGKLVLVTAITPTPAGEGKTTMTIGLSDALNRLGKRVAVALREPSLGPVFGVKGGAAGGGYAQVVPMEDINLHFTGDLHAVSAANNLLAAMLDNHIFQGDTLNIHPKKITWKRCIDMNDRQLRSVIDGLGAGGGVAREDGFDITVASEVMAAMCLADDIQDLKKRLARIVAGFDYDNKPVTAADLNAQGAMAALLKHAIKPNLVQTLEHTPVLIHGGPFANIAHGCNSVIATRMAMKLGDYAVTEAGFGADLGAEKFLDIKCRITGLRPSAVVVVATVRALKHHGQGTLCLDNLMRHVDNITNVYKLPCVVAVNRFSSDAEEELDFIAKGCERAGVKSILSEVWGKGGEGGLALAEEVVRLCEQPSELSFAYDLNDSIKDKLDALVKRIYRGKNLVLTPVARKQAEHLTSLGFGNLPICVAKTPLSFSDDPRLLGAPEGFDVTVRQLRVSAGAGFIVALTGEVMTMPGLPKVPSATNIDIDANGNITGLF